MGNSSIRFWLVLAFVLGGATLRLLPHPENVVPIGALALFSGAKFESRGSALLVPLLAMAISDWFIGFHVLSPAVYGAFLGMVGIGFALRSHRSIAAFVGVSAIGSLLFYVVTNFGVWALTDYYPHTSEGLLLCYVRGLPYLGRTFASTLAYGALLFGSWHLLERRFALRPERGIA